jgi:hypothetical protein
MTTAPDLSTSDLNRILSGLGGDNYGTREEWLNAARDLLRQTYPFAYYLDPANAKLDVVLLSAGFPGMGKGTAEKNPSMGESWLGVKAQDGRAHVYVNPRVADPVGVLVILAHQLLHVAMDDTSHDYPIRRALRHMGHNNRLTKGKQCRHDGSGKLASYQEIADKLGPYPAAPLDASIPPKAKQTTRLLKLVCRNGHDYVGRFAAKPLEVFGTPICPACYGASPQPADITMIVT